MPCEQGALHVRQDSLVEADDAGEALLPGAHPREQVLSDLLLDRAIDVAAPSAGPMWPADRAKRLRGMIAALLHPSDTMSVTVCSHLEAVPAGANVRCCGIFSRSCNPTTSSGPRAAERRRLDYPGALLAGAVRAGGRPGLPQMREPPAHRVVQGPRRVHQDRPDDRRGTGPGSGGGQRREPRAGVAFAAGLLGASATVVMPERAPLPKVAATRRLQGIGDPARGVGRGCAGRGAAVRGQDYRRRVASTRSTTRTSYAQGTLGFEIIEQCPQVRTILVPVGGGGLAAGVTVAVQSLRPRGQDRRGAGGGGAWDGRVDGGGAPGAVRGRADDGRRDRGPAAGRHSVLRSWPGRPTGW